MWTTWPQTRPRRASFAHVPTFAQVHEAIKQQNSVSLQDIDARYIDIYLYSKGARSPRLLFLLDPSVVSDSGRLEHGNASKMNRKSCARTPPGPTLGFLIGQFNFHMTASLLGEIATDSCRGGQLERPGDVICEGNRRISAAHAPSRSANLFCTVSQFHMSRFAMCIMPVFGVVSFAASGALRSAAVAS